MVISDGLIWQIGFGSTVRIWGDKWLNTPSTYMVTSPPKILPKAAKVEELIDQDRKEWNSTLIGAIFNEEDRVAITSISISFTTQSDTLVWRGTKNGVFSVRSAYHMLKEQESSNILGSSIRRGQNAI